ncbi:hypothetical protein [Caballeronia sp. ATUFL_F2_KS9A]|uniref:hypothetical protein n=1 Tax=Caballeronia sp. ATUFL_F2_KS9A TaxID=2921777 RepID=UPI00202816E5|nr:hypothetical protein [Caballeronia sp. ATUFL_F2_KS9A]
MKMKTVAAVVMVGDRQVAADYDVTVGRIRITSDAAFIEDIVPPDSWIALNSVAEGSEWGTHPTPDDLRRYLERYVAERGTPAVAQLTEREDGEHRSMGFIKAVRRWLTSREFERR